MTKGSQHHRKKIIYDPLADDSNMDHSSVHKNSLRVETEAGRHTQGNNVEANDVLGGNAADEVEVEQRDSNLPMIRGA